MTTAIEPQDALAAFDQELQRSSLQGHWKMELPSFLEPKSRLHPMHWRWSQLHEFLRRSGDLISVNEAGRRTVQLMNPGITGPRQWTTHNLQMSFQLVLPGEVATAHRHTMNAIRFVISGGGTYTTVDGESFLMEPGDLILTPGWTWHDHINESEEPIVWIDGLDVPLQFAMNAAFIEEFSAPQQPVKRIVRTAADGTEGPDGSTWYWKGPDAEERLKKLAKTARPDEPVVFEYRHPDGRPTLPTLLCTMQLLRPGEVTTPRRHTAAGIYHVVSGTGVTTIGLGGNAETTFEWQSRDAMVVPNWTWHQHQNRGSEVALLFSMNDQPTLESMGLYRQETRETAAAAR
ncbi:MAG: cupin domain-containing protein [Chloroflexi bacterium]|nr:cupin domain-containing protein [Chloroflexota bacterium]